MLRSIRPIRRRGAALIEAAVVLPVLLLLIGIAADYSRIMYSTVTLSGTARNGAMYQFDPLNTTESSYADYSTAALADAYNLGRNVSVSTSSVASNGVTDVTVTANTTFRMVSSWMALPLSKSVNRSIVVRQAPLVPATP
jgi:Flp pilus assembly protein TadG